MGWVEDLYGSRVYLDTAPFIVFIEDHPVYARMLNSFFKAVLVSNAKYFLTNDLRLPSLPGLTVLKLDELKTTPEYTNDNTNDEQPNNDVRV